MGSSRVIPASTTPSVVQTHAPSGSSSPPIPMLDMSSLIKCEPSPDLDVALNHHCRSENWAESYQDLSSWCSATSASSPATCQSPDTDETFATGIDFHGEIDFDLRKSEQIASIPLEEDSSFNWGVGDSSSPISSVLSAPSTEVSNPVLLKDCWWSEIERGKVVKELESSRPLPEKTTIPASSKNHFNQVTAAVVTDEAANIKENMNPIVVPQVLLQQQQHQQHPFLSDPIKMAELQMRFERIASLAQPGTNSKAKAMELMQILKEQMAALNKKKLQSPAAVSDLHNYHARLQVEPSVPSASVAVGQSQEVVSSVPVPVTPGDIFQSDPFEGLFPVPEVQTQQVTPVYVSGVSSEFVPPQHLFFQNAVVAPAFVQHTFQPNMPKFTPQDDSGSSALHSTDLFFEAHHEIMREAPKPQQFETLQCPQPQLQLPASQPQTFHSTNQMSAPTPSFINGPATVKMDDGMTTQRPPLRLNMPELEAITFDALLFGSPGTLAGIPKVPVMSTPDVLKPLVDTPDPESFDLLSYLCDDKVSPPPVGLDSNPFRFPQSNISQNIPTVINTATATEHKSNVMVVKPLTTEWVKEEEKVSETVVDNENDMSVVVEVKPQLMPSALSDVEEDDSMETESVEQNSVEPIKEEQISPRPSRISRKRKYSEDEFELSLSPSVDKARFSRQRRSTSSKYDSDEDFTLPSRKSRKKSIAPITEEDDEDDDDVKPKRPRAAATVKRGERTVSTSSESDRYRELRDRNNEASRKSRLTRKAREQELGSQADVLTRENRILKVKVGEMENLVKKLREALLQSMMKKS